MTFTGIFIVLFQAIFNAYLSQWGFSLQRKDIEVDEDLPNFFKTVKLSYAENVVEETSNMKDNYLVQIEDPRFVEVVDMTKMPKVGI